MDKTLAELEGAELTAALQKKFSKQQLQGRHFTTFDKDVNEMFLKECLVERRDCADMLRIALEERYEQKKVDARKLREITGLLPDQSAVRQTPHLGQRSPKLKESDAGVAG